jgi:hypothetical protein
VTVGVGPTAKYTKVGEADLEYAKAISILDVGLLAVSVVDGSVLGSYVLLGELHHRRVIVANNREDWPSLEKHSLSAASIFEKLAWLQPGNVEWWDRYGNHLGDVIESAARRDAVDVVGKILPSADIAVGRIASRDRDREGLTSLRRKLADGVAALARGGRNRLESEKRKTR